MAMVELLDGMGYTDITVHGFRSTFQDWAEEYGEYPEVLADKAIAHKTLTRRGVHTREETCIFADANRSSIRSVWVAAS